MNEISNDKKLEALRRALAEHPDDTAAVVGLAQFYADLGWLNEALELYQKLVDRNGDDPVILLDYGNLLFRRERFDEALAVFVKLTALKPARIEGWNNLGIVQTVLGHDEEAKKALDKVLEIEPANAGALLNMGNYHHQHGSPANAIDCFERAIKVSPDFADAWFNLGNVHREQGDYDKAVTAYQKTLRYQPSFPSAHKNLGLVHQATGDYEKAEECYKKALELNKADAGTYSNLGVLRTLQDRYDEAKEYFLRAVKIAPRELGGWMGLRHLSLVKGDIATYVRATLAVLSRLSGDSIAQSCATLRELGHFEECDTLLGQSDAIGKTGDILDAERLLAYTRTGGRAAERDAIVSRFLKIGEPPLAVAAALSEYFYGIADYPNALHFVQIIEKRTLAHDRLYWDILLAMGEVEQVEHEVRTCLMAHPDYFYAWFALAKVQALRKDDDACREAIIKALESGFSDIDQIEKDPVLKRVYDSLNRQQAAGSPPE